MGWSSGSSLMESLIGGFDETLGKCEIPEATVIAFWQGVIQGFEDDDWDTQEECVGLSASWDKAYFASHPYEDGYSRREAGATNPYAEGTEEARLWREGFECLGYSLTDDD